MNNSPRLTLVFWTGITALLMALSAPALAQGAVRLDHVNTSRFPEIAATVVTSRPNVTPTLRENGQRVTALEATNLGDSKSVVVAVDRSMSMEGEALVEAVAAARSFVEAKGGGDRVAIAAFGANAVLLTKFAASTIDADIALRTMGVDSRQGTALYDAVALAARELRREQGGARVLVILTDGADQGSAVRADAAIDAARRAGVTVYAIGIEGPQFSAEPLQRLATETGGGYHGAAGADELVSAYAAVTRDLRRTWRLSWMTRARPGDELTIAVAARGDASATVRTKIPGEAPSPSSPSGIVPESAYSSSWGALVLGLITGLLTLLAVGFAAAAKRGQWVRRRLASHVGRRVEEPGRPRERFAAGNALVAATEEALGSLSVWRKVHRLLERADVPLKTAEFLYVCVGAAFALGMVAAVSGRSSLLILAAFCAGGVAPVGFLAFRAKKRLNAFDNQLPDLLLTLAASLKAGHSFKQGLQSIVDEGQPPASEAFKRVLAEVRLGRPMDDALREVSDHVGSKNLDFVISAITIQSQVGGSLAGLFELVSEAVRQRQQFARKVRALTAEGRASAYVLVALPFGLAGLLTLINADYMGTLWHTTVGHILVGVALVMMAVGSLVLRQIVSFKG